MHYAGGLLPDLVEDDIRVLVYAGQADMRKFCLPTSQIKWLTASMHQLSTTSDVRPSLITSRQAISLPTLLRPS